MSDSGQPVPNSVPVTSGLRVWLRSDGYLTVGGTTVSSWADRRGLPPIATQGDNTRQPTSTPTNAFGPYPGVVFGAQGNLLFDHFDWGVGEFTFVALAKPGGVRDQGGSLTSNQRILWGGTQSVFSMALSAGNNGIALYEPSAAFPSPAPLEAGLSVPSILQRRSHPIWG